MFLQILPVNIKSLAGSVATLANWLVSWVITMTANLLLTWSDGGFSFSPLCISVEYFHSLMLETPFNIIWTFAINRDIHNLYGSIRLYYCLHSTLGAGDQGKNFGRNSVIF